MMYTTLDEIKSRPIWTLGDASIPLRTSPGRGRHRRRVSQLPAVALALLTSMPTCMKEKFSKPWP